MLKSERQKFVIQNILNIFSTTSVYGFKKRFYNFMLNLRCKNHKSFIIYNYLSAIFVLVASEKLVTPTDGIRHPA